MAETQFEQVVTGAQIQVVGCSKNVSQVNRFSGSGTPVSVTAIRGHGLNEYDCQLQLLTTCSNEKIQFFNCTILVYSHSEQSRRLNTLTSCSCWLEVWACRIPSLTPTPPGCRTRAGMRSVEPMNCLAYTELSKNAPLTLTKKTLLLPIYCPVCHYRSCLFNGGK